MKTENERLNGIIRKDEEQKKGLNQKIQILENSFEELTKEMKEKEKFEKDYNNTKYDLDILQTKYDSLNSEMEIYKKNLKKNFNMEKEIKQLTEENEKLSEELKKASLAEEVKLKNEQLEEELDGLRNEKENLLNENKRFKSSNEELKTNLEKIKSSLENSQSELKLKIYQLNQKIQENNVLNEELKKLKSSLEEIEYKSKMGKVVLENQNKELKKQIEKIYQEQDKLINDNKEMAVELKKFKTFTNFAKINKETYTKKDFSMLETMSRKVEEVSGLNDSLKRGFEALNNENTELKNKTEMQEKLLLYYMKNQNDENGLSNLTIDENSKNYKEIADMKLDNKTLIKMLFKAKAENLKLTETMQEITIEFNQKLRHAVDKTKE